MKPLINTSLLFTLFLAFAVAGCNTTQTNPANSITSELKSDFKFSPTLLVEKGNIVLALKTDFREKTKGGGHSIRLYIPFYPDRMTPTAKAQKQLTVLGDSLTSSVLDGHSYEFFVHGNESEIIPILERLSHLRGQAIKDHLVGTHPSLDQRIKLTNEAPIALNASPYMESKGFVVFDIISRTPKPEALNIYKSSKPQIIALNSDQGSSKISVITSSMALISKRIQPKAQSDILLKSERRRVLATSQSKELYPWR